MSWGAFSPPLFVFVFGCVCVCVCLLVFLLFLGVLGGWKMQRSGGMVLDLKCRARFMSCKGEFQRTSSALEYSNQPAPE